MYQHTNKGVELPPDFRTLVLYRSKVEEGYVCTSTTKGVVFPPDECPKLCCCVGKFRGVYVCTSVRTNRWSSHLLTVQNSSVT